ncbi:hypothetical protein U1Q18_029901 [Sarracenia purpurea var. burkii]
MSAARRHRISSDFLVRREREEAQGNGGDPSGRSGQSFRRGDLGEDEPSQGSSPISGDLGLGQVDASPAISVQGAKKEGETDWR